MSSDVSAEDRKTSMKDLRLRLQPAGELRLMNEGANANERLSVPAS